MTIYPAIDIFKGKVVRLMRGDYNEMTAYNDDPVAVAQGFKEAGATALHIVDLEGAKEGTPANFELIKKIVAETGLSTQVGGGIRTEETIEKYLSIGVKRTILGTAATFTQGFLPGVLEKFGDAIAVSVDVKDGFVAVKGWTELTEHTALTFCRAVAEIGVKTLICTDVSKDGLLEGTNMKLYQMLRMKLDNYIIASGGVTTLKEIETLAKLKINGAILGKALYTGTIDLAEAIKTAQLQG